MGDNMNNNKIKVWLLFYLEPASIS